MKLYQVSATGDFGDANSMVVWTGAQKNIPAAKRLIREKCLDDGLLEPHVEEIEFSTTKDGILALLNTYAARG